MAAISDASKVRVYGPGVMDGILATYQSHFTVNTRGAGAGELTIKIRGPRGVVDILFFCSKHYFEGNFYIFL